jgi:hypothetical protein
MELTKISKNKFGTTYKLKNEINLDFKNIKTLFCIEKIYNYRYIKWNIKNLDKIVQFEQNIKLLIPTHNVKSTIINKPNYPLMLLTKVPNYKNNSIIDNNLGEINSLSEYIDKDNIYNVSLSIKNIFVGQKDVKYSIYLNKIAKCVLK